MLIFVKVFTTVVAVIFAGPLITSASYYGYFGGNSAISSAVAIERGIIKAYKECKRQFRGHRFDCPTKLFYQLGNPSKRHKYKATKELAFVRSIISAAVVRSITMHCDAGKGIECACKPRGDGTFNWSGCHNHLKWAVRIAENMMDSKEEGNDIQSLINLHNHQVGRRAVESAKKRFCRCHGVSGACTMKSCWMKLNDFKGMGRVLKSKYENAYKIRINHAHHDIHYVQSLLPNLTKSMVYLDDSPDYCNPDPLYGSEGTLQRRCVTLDPVLDKTLEQEGYPNDVGTCQDLCLSCNYTTKLEERLVDMTCKCSFKWCCQVSCKRCKKRVNICVPKEI